MQLCYEIEAAEQAIKNDQRAGGQPEHIRRQIKHARQSFVLSQLKVRKDVNNGRSEPAAK